MPAPKAALVLAIPDSLSSLREEFAPAAATPMYNSEKDNELIISSVTPLRSGLASSGSSAAISTLVSRRALTGPPRDRPSGQKAGFHQQAPASRRTPPRRTSPLADDGQHPR